MVETKTRQSNFELLRIISMFSVLLIHANFFALGSPGEYEIKHHFIDSFTRIFVQTISIPGVNVFVLISGWFGISYTSRGLFKFIYQYIFIYLFLALAAYFINDFTTPFYSFSNWFVNCYLVLFITAPIINSFVNESTREVIRKVLVLFFIVQSVLGWMLPKWTGFFLDGYTPLSFMWLYLLGRYMSVFSPEFTKLDNSRNIKIILLCVSINILANIIPFLSLKYNLPKIGGLFLSYLSPTTICISAFTLLFFKNIRIQSRFVNIVASGCFAVFLVHTSPNVMPYYVDFFKRTYINICDGQLFHTFEYWCLVFVVLIAVFAMSLLLDQIRKWSWNLIERMSASKRR